MPLVTGATTRREEELPRVQAVGAGSPCGRGDGLLSAQECSL